MANVLKMLSMLRSRTASSMVLLFAMTTFGMPAVTYAQASTKASGSGGSATVAPQLTPGTTSVHSIRTDSPRDTLESFLRLAREGEDLLLDYRKNQTRSNVERVRLLGAQLLQLIDLSSVPSASRHEVGSDNLGYLFDILGRVDLPPSESVPGADVFDNEVFGKWRIPGTPITIVRIEEGPREGEFLFSERTVTVAPVFYQRIRHLPLRESVGIETWHQTLLQLHGPAIPVRLVAALPDTLKQTWLDTPIWKILTVVILSTFATILLLLWHRIVNAPALKNRIQGQLRGVLTPVAIMLVVLILRRFIALEVNVAGTFALAVDSATTLVIYLAAVWIFWLAVLTLFEWMILSPKIPDLSLDANLLRLSARIVGAVGVVSILAFGAQELGVPILGLVAGLGVGGIAVALAIRPTLENLIGGVILFIDRPVRVGDFCGFGERMGTVEYVGVRSTQIRALDRTLISIPNAIFADMEIVNWAKCDRMLIQRTIGLRYETEPDQLRYVLVKLREMFYAHPKIDRDTVRVRFIGHGESSLDVEIRVYALTQEWNEFYAIQEDAFLRADEIVRESGTGFAFPSHTVYMGRDGGLDAERSDAALQQVRSWRKSARLPFPRLASSRIDELTDTLDYPPLGSPDADVSDAHISEVAEPLSAGPQIKDMDSELEQGESERR